MKTPLTPQSPFADLLYWQWQGPPNSAAVASEVGFMAQTLQLSPGAKVLDLGCGLGFHSLELARRGYDVTGLDFSEAFLKEAKNNAAAAGVAVTFLAGDMTQLDFAGEFDGVILWGYTFGFFAEAGNRQTLLGIRRALKPGGSVLLDTQSFRPLSDETHPITSFTREDCPYIFLTQDTVERGAKRFGFTVVAIDVTDGKTQEMNFSWRNYTDEELTARVTQAGLELITVYGDDPALMAWEQYESGKPYSYAPEAFGPNSAKRILLCRAPKS